jgi:VWFA-related protein
VSGDVLPRFASAQSRRSAKATTEADGTIVSVTAWREGGKTEPIKPENLYFYENGIEQKIKNFSFDPSPARIVLLVDNSQTLPTDIEKLKQATMEFAYEIFDGDQLFVVAYDEKPEIIQEWTDDSKKMEASLATFRKKGNPYLFDALNSTVSEVLLPLMPGTRKTAVVVIGDGFDRGSKTPFDKILRRAAKSKHHRLFAANSRPHRRRVSPQSAESERSYHAIDRRHGRQSFPARRSADGGQIHLRRTAQKSLFAVVFSGQHFFVRRAPHLRRRRRRHHRPHEKRAAAEY